MADPRGATASKATRAAKVSGVSFALLGHEEAGAPALALTRVGEHDRAAVERDAAELARASSPRAGDSRAGPATRELPPGQCIVSTPFFSVALAPGPPATRWSPGFAAAGAAAQALATASAQVRVRSGVFMLTIRLPGGPRRFPENDDGAAS